MQLLRWAFARDSCDDFEHIESRNGLFQPRPLHRSCSRIRTGRQTGGHQPELWGNLGDAYPLGARRASACSRRLPPRNLLWAVATYSQPKDAALLVKLGHYHNAMSGRGCSRPRGASAQYCPSDGFVLFKSAVTLNNLEATDRALDLLEKACGGLLGNDHSRYAGSGNLWRYPRFQDPRA